MPPDETSNMNAPSHSENDAVERQIANWKFVRPLGKGGMAEVFEVENARLGTHAALKLFSCAKDKDGEVRARFLAEAALLARLNHPRLVRVFDYGIDPATDCPYFVMDLVLDPSGTPRTLADKEFVGADEDHVALWYDDLRDALAFIHAHGIIHRDVKLQNVLVGPDGHAVLSDFGVAKIFDTSLREDVGLSPEETIHAAEGRRTVMGSLGYLAPELEMGVAASPASDYYALGVLAFYLLTGTWCEPRTDIATALETYDSVWQEILPKLLHANPSARECPSWRDCETKEREKKAAEWEIQTDSFKYAIRTVRRRNLVALFLVGLLGIGMIGMACAWMFSIPVPAKKPFAEMSINDICYIPTELRLSVYARKDMKATKIAMNKALGQARNDIRKWITYLKKGEISCQAAIDMIDCISKIPPKTPKGIDAAALNIYTETYQYLLDTAIDNLENLEEGSATQ